MVRIGAEEFHLIAQDLLTEIHEVGCHGIQGYEPRIQVVFTSSMEPKIYLYNLDSNVNGWTI